MPDLRFLWKHRISGARRPLLLRRTLNAGFGKLAQIYKSAHTPFMPFSAIVEPTNVCQLQCPLCMSGMRVKGRPKGYMTLETARKAAGQLGPYLFDVELDNWGESLLHPEIFQIIKLFKAQKVHVEISSNLSVKEFDAEATVASGLDLLIVSTDAATEKSYLKYRRGGDFQLVLSNIKTLVETRRKMKKNNPYILMKFLTFPHNIHEQDQFRALAARLGADDVLFWPPNYPSHLIKNYFEKLNPEQIELLARSKPKPMRSCHWPWSSVAINWDGSVSACCLGNSYHPQYDLGNINDRPFKEIWFGEAYAQARRVFAGERPAEPGARPCWMCYSGRQGLEDSP